MRSRTLRPASGIQGSAWGTVPGVTTPHDHRTAYDEPGSGILGPDGHDEPGPDEQEHIDHEARAREKFGGVNLGAAFFGWLVALAMGTLLVGIAGAVAAGVGTTLDVTQIELRRDAGTVGMVTAAVLLGVLVVAYYTGGYVAGRMSRYDGAKQGMAVWAFGLVVSLLAVVLVALFGEQYDVLARVDLPRIPLSPDEITTAGVVVGAVVLLVTLAAAALGGKVGHRYHHRVDRAAGR